MSPSRIRNLLLVCTLLGACGESVMGPSATPPRPATVTVEKPKPVQPAPVEPESQSAQRGRYAMAAS
ncbi:MAG TPA: hypothetical protein VM100_06740 [Longimicrobiales bacterium]|nr:hypothetical protein [Longimicrobiales bacterium]